ncbi:hypothetical protein R1sor_009168 [Riccia sorocarpa]|uniref:Uncharacterized protein n=1 Tax=Riccia sorocarpa TaxID=122646 RepID=A0ABD3H7T6_9MARC
MVLRGNDEWKQKSKSRETDKTCKGKKSKKRVKLIPHDYEAMVAYIEDPEHFSKVMEWAKDQSRGSDRSFMNEDVGEEENVEAAEKENDPDKGVTHMRTIIVQKKGGITGENN